MRNINTPDFSNISTELDTTVDFLDSQSSIEKSDALLSRLSGATAQTISNKEVAYREDAEFKYGAGKCMAFCENIEGKNLAMFDAYLKNTLI